MYSLLSLDAESTGRGEREGEYKDEMQSFEVFADAMSLDSNSK